MKIDVIIPVYKPGNRLREIFRRLEAQTQPVNRIIIMNTEKAYWDRWVEETKAAGDAGTAGDSKDAGKCEKVRETEAGLPGNLEVYHVTKDEFDHGATRDAGIEKSAADVCVLMTDDALPADRYLIENLTAALFKRDDIAVAYAKQLPDKSCGFTERYTRSFNYPDESRIKTIADLDVLGIKTYFCSNVCAAYKRKIYLELGGFTQKTIFNEDMIFAAKAMKAGYAVCYEAGARVVHSHNYTGLQQFHRNFDLAVSQADHPEVFLRIRSEGEGVRLVKKTAAWLVKNGKFYLLPQLIVNSGCKYMGYLLGKRYRCLPMSLVRLCTMNKNYWKGYERQDV